MLRRKGHWNLVLISALIHLKLSPDLVFSLSLFLLLNEGLRLAKRSNI